MGCSFSENNGWRRKGEMDFSTSKKKWQVTYIAPLQPPTLAVFRPWGSSAGAGRARPAAAKIKHGDETYLLISLCIANIKARTVAQRINTCNTHQLIRPSAQRTIIHQNGIVILGFPSIAFC